MYFLGKNAGINELSVSFRVFQKDNDSKVICKTDDFMIGYGGADKKCGSGTEPPDGRLAGRAAGF